MPLSAKDWDKMHREAERVAVELAHRYANKPPLEAYMRTTVTSYYENGRVYETNHFSTLITEMSGVLSNAKKYGWTVTLDEKAQIIKLYKRFPNGMYRIAEYEPYDKSAITISDDGDDKAHYSVNGEILT